MVCARMSLSARTHSAAWGRSRSGASIHQSARMMRPHTIATGTRTKVAAPSHARIRSRTVRARVLFVRDGHHVPLDHEPQRDARNPRGVQVVMSHPRALTELVQAVAVPGSVKLRHDRDDHVPGWPPVRSSAKLATPRESPDGEQAKVGAVNAHPRGHDAGLRLHERVEPSPIGGDAGRLGPRVPHVTRSLPSRGFGPSAAARHSRAFRGGHRHRPSRRSRS